MKIGFSEIFRDETKYGTKIPKEKYLPQGEYPIIDQGQNDIAGYTDNKEGIYTNVPAIIFGDHTRIIKYIDMPFFLGADGVKLLKAKKENIIHKYLYYALLNAKIPDTGYNRHFKWLKEVEITLVDLEEQKKIAAVLDKVCDLIALRRKQLEQLDKLVKSRFVEMFGDVLNNSKHWPTKTFSDIATSRLGKMLDSKRRKGECNYPYLANFNVQWFRFNLEKLNKMDFTKDEQLEFELQDGDLLVCEGGEIGRCAVWHNNLQPCFFQKALHRVRCDRTIIEPNYLAWWFRYNCDHEGFSSIVGAKATITHLPGVKLKQLKVCVPTLKLQQQFSALIIEIDKLKLPIQHSLDTLEVLKKSLMQDYFG